MSTLPGFTSRCTTPCACANDSASAISAAMRAASVGAETAVRLQDLAQRLPGDVLHHDEGGVVLLAPVVDRDDVRVVEPGGGLRLAAEALDVDGIRRELRRGAPSPRRDGRAGDRARGTRRPCRRGRSLRPARSGSRRRGWRAAWSRQATHGFVGQQVLEQLLRDRCGDLAAGRLAAEVAAVLDDHRHRVPRRVRRRERDEPRVRVLALDAGLRGAGLARDLDSVDRRATRRCRCPR